MAAYKANAERWICLPDDKIKLSCLTGECSDCTKPPYRRKIKYSEVQALGKQHNVSEKLINRGMLWRPVVRRKIPV